MQTAIYNPHKVDVATLPVIYGFNQGSRPDDWATGVLLAENGEILGSHHCSHECYMPGDLGIIEGSRPDRHKVFQSWYPNGYRMEFVPFAERDGHAGLHAAYARHVDRYAPPRPVLIDDDRR